MITYKQEDIFSLKKCDNSLPESVEKKLQDIFLVLTNRNNRKTSIKYNNGGNSNQNGWRTIVREKYKSNFKSNISDDPIKMDINSILNKVSNNNFAYIHINLTKLLETIDDDEYLEYIFDVLLQNSIKQPVFCKYYVKLLDLIPKKDLIIDKFKSYSNEMVDDNKSREYREGYSLFIVEIFNHNFIDNSYIDETINNLFDELSKNKKNAEKIIECLFTLFKNIDNKKTLNEYKQCFKNNIEVLSGDTEIPMKSRFKLLDIKDL